MTESLIELLRDLTQVDADGRRTGYDISWKELARRASEELCDLQKGEIPVVDEEIKDKIYDAIEKRMERLVREEYCPEQFMPVVFEAIRPYLRTTEPVSVSLEKCAMAVMDAKPGNGAGYVLAEKYAKAVLDAAGVKYVD